MLTNKIENYLVITAIGKDRPGIVDELTKAILDSGCNIEDSRMTVLGGEFAILLLVSGKWNELAKYEDSISVLQKRLQLTITATRTEETKSKLTVMAYSVEVLSIDQPGIVHELANFFSKREINIRELNTCRYAAAHTGAPMFSLTMTVNIPADVRIANLRDEFLEYCDNLNMDAVLEPIKL